MIFPIGADDLQFVLFEQQAESLPWSGATAGFHLNANVEYQGQILLKPMD
jgi:hypothetical protein